MNDNQKQLVTVAEYARMRGVSSTAIYKQLKTSLKPFITVVNNRTMIDISALNASDAQADNNRNEQRVNNEVDNNSTEVINRLTAELSSAKAQLDAAQAEIARLDKYLEQTQTALNQSQTLHMLDKQRLLTVENKLAELEAHTEPSQDAPERAENASPAVEHIETPQARKTLWQRIFG